MILDGGLGGELIRRGVAFRTKLWSSEPLLDAPDILIDVHRDFLAAGAQVVATASYQLSHCGLRELGVTDDSAIDAIFARAVTVARTAIDEHAARNGDRTPKRVAASLGPYGATVGDGSEYSGVRHLERDALIAFHAQRLRSVVRARPDIVLFETIPTQFEATAIAAAVGEVGIADVWLSFSCADAEHTYGGDRLADAVAALESQPAIATLGVNCTSPEHIAALVDAIRFASAKPLFVNPNLGQHWESDAHALAGGDDAAAFVARVPAWLASGVDHIGGCCGVGPDTIAKIAVAAAAARDTASVAALIPASCAPWQRDAACDKTECDR